MKKDNTIDFTSGGILKKFITFVIPLIITGLLQVFFNAADLIVAGQFAGEKALAAVGSTSSLINLILGLAIGLSVGANIVAAFFIGSNDRELVKKTVDTAIAVALACGVVCMLVGIIGARFLLEFMDTPEDVIDQAVAYFRTYFAGIPAAMIYNFCAAILRAAGESRKPLVYLSVSGVTNVILNIIFITQLHMGAAGVGLATAISQYLSAFLVVRDMMRTDEIYKFTPKSFKTDSGVLKRILSVGVPSGIQSMVFSFSNIIIQSSINSFGSEVVAGSSAASNIEGFAYIAMNAFSVAATTVVGQNVGAKKIKRIAKTIDEIGALVMAVGIVLGGLVYIFGEPLARLYCPDSDVAVEYAQIRLLYIAVPYFLCGLYEGLTGTLKACGYAITSMIIALVCCCGVRIVWIYTVFPIIGTIECIYILYAITWILAVVACVLLYLFGARRNMAKKFARVDIK